METERHYFIVGVFVLVVLTCAVVFTAWTLNRHERNERTDYVIYFDDAITGVDTGTDVRLKGIAVGKVKSIAFDPANKKRIRMVVSLASGSPIDSTTKATIQPQGITGLSFVSLSADDTTGGAMQKDAEGLPIIPSEPSPLQQVVSQAPQILDNLRALTDRANKLLSDDNLKSFGDSLTSLNHLMSSADHAVSNIDGLTTQGRSFFSDSNSGELREMLNEGKLTMRELRFLAKSLRDDPSQVIYRPDYQGFKPDAPPAASSGR